MDIDRFVAGNGPVWDRLAALTRRAGRGARRLSPAELEELVVLYQRASTHLSYARTNFPDPGLLARLNRVVAAAGTVIYGTRPRSLRAAGRFFTRTFPAALAYVRPFLVVAASLTFVPAAAANLWLKHSPPTLEATASKAQRAAYTRDAVDYYSEQPSAQFATEVFTNNVRVAVQAFAGGITLGLLTVFILVQNGLALGVATAVFASAGKEALFYGLLVPHGLIELSAVVVAGAAGLRLGWTVVDPGDRRRLAALAEEGRRSIALVFGVAAMLAVAGTIEGFVTGSSLPTWARVGTGVAVEVAFVAYAWSFGRAARLEGLTGLIGEADQGWSDGGLGAKSPEGGGSVQLRRSTTTSP